MKKLISRSEILISKRRVAQKRGVVILDLDEYEKLLERAVPTYYLTGKAAEHIDKLYEEGMREYKQGKTIKAESLGEALKIYERTKNRKTGVFKKVSKAGKETTLSYHRASGI